MKNELHTLQIVRGVAAMMVVTNHLLGGAFPLCGEVFLDQMEVSVLIYSSF